MLSIQDAAYHSVHGYPGGAQALALRLKPKKSTGALCQEVRPPVGSSAKLGIETAAQIIDLSGDHAIAHAFCARVGGMFVPLPIGEGTPREVLKAVAKVSKEFGELVTRMSGAVVDGEVTLNELRRVEKEATDLMQALQTAMSFIRAMHGAKE